ncbi:AfsR/SARP family transcriptional regulator [Saccharothrix syringae]|uniref:AfsR/SARP family transcriptional regulator n=1 Tax=Saccharothrix syringae TaxID=103733 RepID=A0A5Q0GRU3_SACSY|nr:BTAD domain-containing putative transcriptional regulator [Saccharothrix syringae]QFZ16082.1 AfsR/SARP family transcriptional regulator [Saccharothrix syringae]
MAVEFRVLGRVGALVGGEPVDVGHARQQCVLAALLVEANRPVTAERLVARVWADRPPHRARQVLSSYVSRLRRAGVEIRRRAGGYVLVVEPERVDLHLFRRLVERARAEGDERASELLERASGLWRGEAFEGLGTPWAVAVREALARERSAADAARVEVALRLGRHEEVLPGLVARVAADPLDERLVGRLVLALDRSGRRAEALAAYERLRERLAEELGTDPGVELRELHERVRGGGSVGAGPVPRQLPAPPRAFTGRVEELARLDAAVGAAAGGAVVISAIGGAGGVGKTWLALHWAHRRADRFPDGQLFVDLRGFSPEGEPMPPATAVRGFLDALGVDPGRVPYDVRAQEALFRELVAGRRMLVVLDNAADADQVRPLLPGSGTCAVVVTSRVRMTGLGGSGSVGHLPLDVLSDREARALLAARLGAARVDAEPAAVGELIGFCGGFPLALGIVAGRVDTYPGFPLSAFVRELREAGLDALDDSDPAASLPAVLSWSCAALEAAQATAFALLGIAPGPDVGPAAAAELLGVPVERARELLAGLENASLVTSDARGRYRMHDLIRRYAVERAGSLPAGGRDAAVRRVVDFYRHTAHAADRLLYPHRQAVDVDAPAGRVEELGDTAAALRWFEAEHACLLAAQQVASGRGWRRAAWHLAWALTTFHYRRGHRREELESWHVGLAAAPGAVEEGLAHRHLGRAYAEVGRYEEAIGHQGRALGLAAGDLPNQSLVHHAMAWTWARRGDDRKALEHVTEALRISRELDDPVREADALNAVGWYRARLGEHGRAREHCRAALDLYRAHRDREGEAAVLDSLGYVEREAGRWGDAVVHHERALDLNRELGNTYEMAGALDCIGRCRAGLGEVDRARTAWREALEMYREQGRDEDVERVRASLASL